MSIQTEIEQTKKEIQALMIYCRFNEEARDRLNKINQTLQMCKEELEAQIQAHKDFVEKLKIETEKIVMVSDFFKSQEQDKSPEKVMILMMLQGILVELKKDLFDIIDKLSAEMQERGNEEN